MSQENQITLRGFLTAEPKFKETAKTGTPMTEIRVGSTPRRLNRETGEWQDLPTSYFKVKCWRRLAINTASSLHKGDMVVIRGRFTMNTWLDSQQQQRSTVEIEADSVGHDLAYGWTHFMRGTRSRGSQGVDIGEAMRQDTTQPDENEERDERDEQDEFQEHDEYQESHESDRELYAEPLAVGPTVALGELGVSANDPSVSDGGDAERSETLALVG